MENNDYTVVISRLQSTYESGVTRTRVWRRTQLEAMIQLLSDRERELLAALAEDLGKPAIEGWMGDLRHVQNEVRYILRNLDRWMKPERVSVSLKLRPAQASIVTEPLGLVLVIAPWNYPIQLLLLPMAYAIAAGNAVVGKPSEISAATSTALSKYLPEYLDEDAIALIEGDGSVVSSLLTHRWSHIFYTGSGRTGRLVMKAAAAHLIPVTLELGGKNPAIVDRSANLKVAARRVAWGRFINAGQTCVAPDYVLVDRNSRVQLVDDIIRAVKSFYGEDPEHSPDYCRIINERHWDRLHQLLDATSATVALGGSGSRAERYLAPTILTNVSWDDPVMREEIFGPILPVVEVESVDDAIAMLAPRDKPLALYIFSETQSVIDKVVAQTSSGGVGVNLTLLHLVESNLPFGGVGESGMGAYHGRAGFDTFSHRKSVMQRSTRLDPALMYPPYGPFKKRVLRRFF